MSHNTHHEHLIKEVEKQFEPLLKNSPQAIYIYLDDEHKTCNEKFAKMLGYKSTKEWKDFLFPVSDIEEKDQKKVIKSYMDASRKFKASTISCLWVRKDKKKIKTEVTFTPFIYEGEVFVLHFISLEN